jgi:hypothetical protein
VEVKLLNGPRDYYAANPSALEGQPKRAIADYVEQKDNRIPVPGRFGSLKEARNSGVEILVRSEHRQDYDGSSGLLETRLLSEFPEAETEAQLKEQILIKSTDPQNQHQYIGDRMIKEHCRLLGIDFDKFNEGVSYSFWELLRGTEIKVVADSSIKGRYHITSKYDYTVFEHGKPIKNYVWPLPEELQNLLPGLVETYETIRNFDRFDPNNCPIMEFIAFNGKIYFLQYHKSRKFEASTFSLDREPTTGEMEVFFARGATKPDGISCNVTVHYAWEYRRGRERSLPAKEDASFDLHYNPAFSELMVRKREMQITGGEWYTMDMFAVGHYEYSKLMKPRVSIVENPDKIISEEENNKLVDIARVENKNAEIKVHAVSDGTRAYLMRI